ncbi:PDZ domain-containing protein, partial [Moraxella catarrhalis]|uniref:PDZ domain-containing protein n=1 Tax=Moraxella catarrhalis TaxID=480 RepID=UPI00217D49F2
RVWQNSPAEHAGLKSGDKIVRIDGVHITSINELVGVVARKAPAPIASYYEAVNRAAQSVVNIYTTQNAHHQLYSNDPVLQQF